MSTSYTDGKTSTIYVYENGRTPASGLGLTVISDIPAFIAAQQTPQLNIHGFEAALMAALGGTIIEVNTALAQYPAFFPTLMKKDWSNLALLIGDANTRGVITTVQYAAIKTAVSANAIPMTLS